jgi:selenide,water dikinase
MDNRIRLSMLTSYHGSEADLDSVLLEHLPPPHANMQSADGRTLIVGQDGGGALIQSLNFFPPVVDDPFVYGEIAAAQAMAGVYALGGEVTFGLSIASWPEGLSPELLRAIVAGGAAKMAEGRATIVGGQTIVAPSPSYGLSVTGTVDPDRYITSKGAQPGDRLYLTKALGTGVILAAAHREAATAAHLTEATASMRRLDRVAAIIARHAGATACIGIAGRGLLRHAAQLAAASGCGLQLALTAVPFLSGALEYAELGFVPETTERNRTAYARQSGAADAEIPLLRHSVGDLLHDPQTSGGLLLSVPAARAIAFQAAFSQARAALWPIGEVVAGTGVRLRP